MCCVCVQAEEEQKRAIVDRERQRLLKEAAAFKEYLPKVFSSFIIVCSCFIFILLFFFDFLF